MLAVQAKNLNVFVALQFGRFFIVNILLRLLKVFVISNYCVFTSQGLALCATGHSGNE